MPESPPDYYEALYGATKRLGGNTRAARQAIYDKARRLLAEEARAADPPWQLVEIVREQRALEEAIEEVEAAWAAEAARPRPPIPQLLPPKYSPPRAVPPRPERRERMPEPVPQHYEEDYYYEPEYVPAPPPPEPPGRRPMRRRSPPPDERRARPWWTWILFGGLALTIVVLLVLLMLPSEPPVVPSAKQPAKITHIPELGPEERGRRVREAIERGNERARQNDFDGAISAYTDAIRLSPGDASIYNNRAFAYWSRGMTDLAIADYDETLRLEPDNVVARTNRAPTC
jgi:tetratricopeptide (TPR) repeat protein